MEEERALGCVHWVEVSKDPSFSQEKRVACRHTIVSGEEVPRASHRRRRTKTVVYPVDREARRGEEGGTEREGVSFKLEIASSAAMMGRKLGAKLNARERSMADELGREGGREEDEALSNRQLRKRDDESNNILIFVRSGEVEDCWERRMFFFSI